MGYVSSFFTSSPPPAAVSSFFLFSSTQLRRVSFFFHTTFFSFAASGGVFFLHPPFFPARKAVSSFFSPSAVVFLLRFAEFWNRNQTTDREQAFCKDTAEQRCLVSGVGATPGPGHAVIPTCPAPRAGGPLPPPLSPLIRATAASVASAALPGAPAPVPEAPPQAPSAVLPVFSVALDSRRWRRVWCPGWVAAGAPRLLRPGPTRAS